MPTPSLEPSARSAPKPAPKLLTVVVSVFDEEAVLPAFIAEARRVAATLDCPVELLFVNDGSGDRSAEIVAEAAASDPRLRLLSLSRNFGHEAAMVAGIDHARGDAVVCMDADLQHPLGELPRMLEAHRQGYDIVTMVRSSTGEPSIVRRVLSRQFYRVLNAVAPHAFERDASDFFLVSRRVVKVLRTEYRERVRFLRGFVQTVGFRKTTLRFASDARSHGRSKYSLKKLLDLSMHALLSFSNLPLRVGVLSGALVALLGIVVAGYSLVMKFLGEPPSGYTTIVVLLCFLFAVQFVITGIIGEYVGYVFLEVKRRPIYIVEQAPEDASDAE